VGRHWVCRGSSLRRGFAVFSCIDYSRFFVDGCGDEFNRDYSRLETSGRQEKRGLWRLIDCVSIGARLRVVGGWGKIGFAKILPAVPSRAAA
jgi:hypothetical protein